MLLQVVPEEGEDVLPEDITYYDESPFDDGNYLAPCTRRGPRHQHEGERGLYGYRDWRGDVAQWSFGNLHPAKPDYAPHGLSRHDRCDGRHSPQLTDERRMVRAGGGVSASRNRGAGATRLPSHADAPDQRQACTPTCGSALYQELYGQIPSPGMRAASNAALRLRIGEA